MKTKRDMEELLSFRVNGGKVFSDNAFKEKGIKAVYVAFSTSADADKLKKVEMGVYIDNYAAIEIKDVQSGYLFMSWDDEYISEPESAMLLYVLSEEYEWLIYKSPTAGRGFCPASVPKKHPSTGEIITRLDSLQYFRMYIEILELLKEKAYGKRQTVYGFCFEDTDVVNRYCVQEAYEVLKQADKRQVK